MKKRDEDKNMKGEDLGREFRAKAEDYFKKAPKSPPSYEKMSQEELLQELRVHQIELEMQNEELRHNQSVLEESRDKYAELYDFAPTGYITLNRDVSIVEANPSAAKLLGVDRAKLIRQRAVNFIDPSYVTQWDNFFKGIFLDGDKKHCEAAFKRPDGKELYVHLEGICVELTAAGKQGERVAYISMSDITERKNTEENLREEEDKYRKLFNESGVGIVINDAQGKLIKCNPAFCGFLGYSENELIGRSVAEITFPEDREKTVEAIRRMMTEDKAIKDYEKRYRHKSGEVKWGKVNAFAISDVLGKPFYAVAQIQDITERKKSEAAICEAEQQWKRTFDAINDSVCLIDPHGRILRHNAATERMFSKTSEELDGRLCYEVAHGLSHPIEGCPIVRMWASGRRESSIIRSGDLWLEVTVDPIFNKEGGLTAAVHVIQNITERRHTEEELKKYRGHLEEMVRERTEELESFSSSVSHDLRAPVRAINSFTHILKEEYSAKVDA